MKDSEIYKVLQRLVVTNSLLATDEKLEMLRLLFEQEDLALFQEKHEEQKEASGVGVR